jgi:hypothetical protein
MQEGRSYREFTEEGFRALLHNLIAGGYRFAAYGEAAHDRHVLWRHDVDYSMHRARRLARIEAEEGARATYFLNPHCRYYNLLEPEIMKLMQEILALGHEVALHFDTEAYGIRQWHPEALHSAVTRERSLLETIVGRPVRCMSWHNPDQSTLLSFADETIGGLTSTYSARMKHDYVYASDSNGYWRFKPMADVIAEGHFRLHLLTHPEWWTPEPMSPSERIDRAILGRSKALRRAYDELLKNAGRPNFGG